MEPGSGAYHHNADHGPQIIKREYLKKVVQERTAVALLVVLDDLVPAEGAGAGGETVPLASVAHGVQHGADVAHAARREPAVVGPVAARRRREHYVVALLPARPAVRRVVVLR